MFLIVLGFILGGSRIYRKFFIGSFFVFVESFRCSVILIKRFFNGFLLLINKYIWRFLNIGL